MKYKYHQSLQMILDRRKTVSLQKAFSNPAVQPAS